MKRLLAIAAISVACVNAVAGGFEDTRRAAPPPAGSDIERAWVGKDFWINFGAAEGCDLERATYAVHPAPDITDKRAYTSDRPTRFHIDSIVRDPSYGKAFFHVAADDGTQGFVDAGIVSFIESPHGHNTPTYLLRKLDCASVASPAETEAFAISEEAARNAAEHEHLQAVAAQQAKPGARIGMTAKQVRDGTNWGEPDSVNRTTTANHVREQWVYGARGYLYFEDGILRTIQN